MTTITEILAEAFNRVKAEHGVTLSRVEYVDAGGVLGLNFKAASTAKGTPLAVHRVTPQSSKPYEGDELVEMTPEKREELRMSLIRQKAPKDATHYGSIEGSSVMYWKYHDGLLGFRVVDLWAPYTPLGSTPPSKLITALTPLT